jgi:periplasmic divalent cation tolerance protein
LANQAVIILTTTSRQDQAEIIAQKLVEGRLAACVQIIAHVKSVYAWEGQIESASESLLVIKSEAAHYAEVEQMITRVHRENAWYQTPEILRIDVDGGSRDYLNWLFLTTGKDGGA